MTFTAARIKLPANVSVRPGQYALFSVCGGFLSVEDRLTNGLAISYVCNQDGSFSRFFF